MSTDFTLSISTVTATIHAPIGQVNIADWILHLPDAEYQRCSTRTLPQAQRPPTMAGPCRSTSKPSGTLSLCSTMWRNF